MAHTALVPDYARMPGVGASSSPTEQRETLMNSLEVLRCHVRVSLRGVKVRVAHDLLQ